MGETVVHFGLTPWVGDLGERVHDIGRQAARAEAMGFHSIWLPESHFLERGACPSPLLPLAAAAALTSTIRLGTTSYLLPIRNPIQVAEEIAVLDRLSQGRVIVGLGRGFRRALFETFDVAIQDKRPRFEAAIEIMLRAWSGEPVHHGSDGPIRLSPLPLQQPHPPLWVAAFGPKALAQAGRLGLPYFASPMESHERLRSNLDLHREALSEHGHAPLTARPAMRTMFCSSDAGVLETARASLKAQVRELARTRIGVLSERDLEDLDSWALVCPPDEFRQRVALLAQDLGLSHIVVRGHIPGLRRQDLETSLEWIAETSIQEPACPEPPGRP